MTPVPPRVRAMGGTVLTVALLGCAGAGAAAQTVRGVLTDRDSGVPLIGALVVLEDSMGAERIYGLTDEEGRFTLRGAAPGAHALRVDRPGVESVWSPTITLDAGAITNVSLPVPSDSIDLRGLIAASAAPCHPGPDGGPVAAMLWTEARKGLLASAVTDQAGLYHYRVRVAEDDRGTAPTAEPEWVSAHPLGAVDYRWREAGFVRTTAGTRVFQPPVPPILLDPLFQARHCFSAVADTTGGERIGLAFESASELPPGVSGTLWLDAATGRLVDVVYEYARGRETMRAGGRMAFEVLDDGAWIVRSWSHWSADAEAPPAARYHEVVAVRPVYDVSPGETLLAGMVFDSVRGRPLGGARVFLWGTDHQTVSDERGRFMFGRDVAPGDYEVSFFHESLSAWDLIPRRLSVSLPPGGETFVELATPSLPTIMARECGEGAVVVAGTVRDAGSELPVPLAQVVLDWSGEGTAPERRMTRTDMRGWYHICDVPRNVGVAASAQVGEGDWTPPTVVAADQDVVLHHLTLGLTGTVRVVGRLVNAETDQAVGGAMVSLLGMDRRVESNEEGEFVFDQLPPGFYEVAVLHPDHGAVSDTLTVRDVGEMDFELQLGGTERAIADADRFQLDPIVVTGAAVERSLAGFYRRRSEGFGGFLTSAEWEVWNPTEVTDIVRRLPGFVVRPNNTYDQMINGQLDTRRYRIDVTRRSSRSATQVCAPLIFLDGALVGNVRDFDVDQLMVQSLEAAESYPSAANMPPTFNVTGAECGVVVLWTKR
jgi:hypothetical protein